MPWHDLLQYTFASTNEALRVWHACSGREASEGTPKSTAVDGGICNSAGRVWGDCACCSRPARPVPVAATAASDAMAHAAATAAG